MTKKHEKVQVEEPTQTESAPMGLDQEVSPAPNGQEERIASLEKELEETGDRLLRLMAEYDNFRKRTAKERESFYENAKSDTVERMLPIYDNLERAASQVTPDEAMRKGVEMILQQFREVFKTIGVSEIEAQGAPFDPSKHNAVLHIEDDNAPENTVAEVLQKGFELNGKVIRYAVVKVAN